MTIAANVPTCECGCALIQVDENCWACMYCDMPQEDMEYFYESVCWSCGDSIDSRICVQSQTPGMGYHCKTCGKDLTEWKRRIAA